MIAAPRSCWSPTNLNARARKSFAPGCDYWHCDFATQATGEHKPLNRIGGYDMFEIEIFSQDWWGKPMDEVLPTCIERHRSVV